MGRWEDFLGISHRTHSPAATCVHCMRDSGARASVGPLPAPASLGHHSACLSGPRGCREADAGELQNTTWERKTGHVETCRPGRSRLRAPAAALRTKTSVPGRAQNTAFGMGQRPRWIPTSTSLDSSARRRPHEKPYPNRTHVQLVAVPNRVSP